MARIVLGSTDPAHPDDPSSVARALRDAGHEVVLATGLTGAALGSAAIQEDADLVIAVGDRSHQAGADVPGICVGPGDAVAAVRWAAAYDR